MTDVPENPFDKIQQEALADSDAENEAYDAATAAADAIVAQLEKVKTAGDVVKLLIRLSAYGVQLAVLAHEIETRLSFVASQTTDDSFRELVSSAARNVQIALEKGRPPNAEDHNPTED